MLTARTKTIERTGTGRQFPPSLTSLSATKFLLQIYMELTGYDSHSGVCNRVNTAHFILRLELITMTNGGVSSISHTPKYELFTTNLSV